MKRDHNGRFISKEKIARRELHKLVAMILFPVTFGILSHYANTPVVFDSGWEPHTAEASFEPVTDLCDLSVVTCEHEKPVQRAVDAVSEALGREVTEETKRRISYLHDRATEAGVPFYDAVKTIYCESQWIAQKSWLPEESYGISQIHIPSHPHITKEQAMDAYFAIDFLVENWWTTAWYGYDRDTGTCSNGLIINL